MTPKERVAFLKKRLETKGVLPFVERICARHLVSVEEVLGPRRYPSIVRARREVWNTMGDTLIWTCAEIGRLFDRDPSTVLEGIRHRRLELELGR